MKPGSAVGHHCLVTQSRYFDYGAIADAPSGCAVLRVNKLDYARIVRRREEKQMADAVKQLKSSPFFSGWSVTSLQRLVYMMEVCRGGAEFMPHPLYDSHVRAPHRRAAAAAAAGRGRGDAGRRGRLLFHHRLRRLRHRRQHTPLARDRCARGELLAQNALPIKWHWVPHIVPAHADPLP